MKMTVAPKPSPRLRQWAVTIHTARPKAAPSWSPPLMRDPFFAALAMHRRKRARGQRHRRRRLGRRPDRADLARRRGNGNSGNCSTAQSVRPWQDALEPLRGYLLLAHRAATEGQRFAGPWNFGPSVEESVSVGKLVDGLQRRWPRACGGMSADDDGPHEAEVLRLDCTKAREKLGWRPISVSTPRST